MKKKKVRKGKKRRKTRGRAGGKSRGTHPVRTLRKVPAGKRQTATGAPKKALPHRLRTPLKKKKITPPKSRTVKRRRKKEKESERAKGLTPMRIYLDQIEHIPLLTPKEEIALSRIIQTKKGNYKHARRKMIQSNLRLVINIAKRYMNLGLPFSDIVEEGNIGLMRAVDKFNYKKGYRFSTYASWWIKQSIMRALSNQGKLIRIPVHMYETMSRWRKVREYLLQKSGKIPSNREIAKIMKVPLNKVKEIEQTATTYPSSLHTPVSLEGEAELIDLIEDDTLRTPHEEAQRVLKNERIEELLGYVNERERKILVLRFGLYHHEPHTLEETAQQFGITRERVRQIEEAALKKIRYQLSLEGDSLENYL